MTDLTAVIHDLVGLFDRLRLPYAIMGGIAVRAHGLPRPTFDVDFVLAVPRERLADLFAAMKEAGYTVADHYRAHRVGRARADARRSGDLSSVAQRAARHRHPRL